MCVILLWPSKITCSLILMQNVLNVWVFEDNLIEKLVFGRFWLNYSVFKKLLISYSCISFMKHYALRSFCIKLLCFSKKIDFFFFPIFGFWPDFFYASFIFRIHMHCIDFLYPSCRFAIISLIIFTHNMHTLYYFRHSTWFKNWLINFWVLYTF